MNFDKCSITLQNSHLGITATLYIFDCLAHPHYFCSVSVHFACKWSDKLQITRYGGSGRVPKSVSQSGSFWQLFINVIIYLLEISTPEGHKELIRKKQQKH